MPSNLRRIALLGATGSIGQSTLDVIARHPQRFQLDSVCANSRVDELVRICEQFKPRVAVIADATKFNLLRDGLQARGLPTLAECGDRAIEEIASSEQNDTVVAAIVGAAGVASTLAAARAGKRILLANKESIVVAGDLLMQAAREHRAELLPVDSEHNAIFQCLPRDGTKQGVRRILLTASGGPFFGRTRSDLASITPEQACAHPKWTMGRKISVDSASLMNKGLEVIEAHHLFNTPIEQIEVVIHPQSVVHSLVDYIDGSVLAQLGNPDMRTAIAYALAFPERIESGVAALHLAELARLEFAEPDLETFPCLQLAFDAIKQGGIMPAVLNAANEVAVEAFLNHQLAFLQIPNVIERTMAQISREPAANLAVLLAADREARGIAKTFLRTN
jgi:1-deoxy-D-xylulose-5-phosphate reductoisomerase